MELVKLLSPTERNPSFMVKDQYFKGSCKKGVNGTIYGCAILNNSQISKEMILLQYVIGPTNRESLIPPKVNSLEV